MNATLQRAAFAAYPLVRVLAPLDALLVPALMVAWVKSLEGTGGAFGTVVGMVAIWWGMAAVVRAVFDFANYRWMALRLAKWSLVMVGLGAAMKFMWRIQG